jgi:HCO3- transporter family
MTFIAPTGLTLAFISGLFRYCSLNGLAFLPVYAWVGLWTSLYMMILGLAGSSKLIRYCTRFTDEVFNGLLSLNFIYEALSSLGRNFVLADPMNLTMPFVALGMALSTFWSTMKVTAFQASKFFNQKTRTTIKNFGPITIFFFMSILNMLPWCSKFCIPTLTVPDSFELAGGRSLFVTMTDIPAKVRLLCSIPAILLTSLFFMDQNISVRVVNNVDNQLKKGAAYNLDMFALGFITLCKLVKLSCKFLLYFKLMLFWVRFGRCFFIRLTLDVRCDGAVHESCSCHD